MRKILFLAIIAVFSFSFVTPTISNAAELEENNKINQIETTTINTGSNTQEKISTQILKDNDNERVVEVQTSEGLTIVKYNKQTTDIEVSLNGIEEYKGNIKANDTFANLGDMQYALAKSITNPSNPAIRDTIYSKKTTYYGAKVKIVDVSYKNSSIKFTEWTAQRDKDTSAIIKIQKGSSDSKTSTLMDFKNAVKAEASKEIEFAAAGGATFASVMATIVAAPTGLGAVIGIFLSAGASLTTAKLAYDVVSEHEDVKLQYNLVKKL